MSTPAYRKIARNVRESEKPYPEGLVARLQWWREALGMDRVRFLRMIGMSSRQAARRKDDDLKEIIESREWADNALGLEGLLVRLVSFYRDDPRVLAESIRESAAARREKTSQPTEAKSAIKRPHARRNGKDSDVWADRIHEGGPDALGALISYLIESQAEADRAES
jgi:hypothetical protein